MDRQTLYKQITQTQSETERLLRGLQMLYYMDATSHSEDYEKISTNLALLGEKITCRLRHLVYDMTEVNKSDYLVAAGDAHGIEIKYEGGIFEITLPRLLPKRKKWDRTEFLLDPLYFTLSNYKRTHNFPLFKHCTICFTHVYDEKLRKSHVRDYDNLELKQVLDTISAFVLLDDTGYLCDMYHTTEFGATSCTRITIIDKEHFSKWLEERKNIPKQYRIFSDLEQKK